MALWGNITFIDVQGKVTNKRVQFSGIVEAAPGYGFDEAASRMAALLPLFAAVTEAAVIGASVTSDAGGTLTEFEPFANASVDSDVTDEAVVQLLLVGTDGYGRQKKYALTVPAPEEALFIGGAAGTKVDPSNVDLIALVDALGTDTAVSDGDAIDYASGIQGGYWRSKARSTAGG